MKFGDFKIFKFSTVSKNINRIRDIFSNISKNMETIPAYILDFFSYIFSGIKKSIKFIIYDLLKIYKLSDLRRLNFRKIYKYFDIRRYDFYKINKKINLKNYRHAPIYFVIFVTATELNYVSKSSSPR